jgi:hypothetical protein
MHFSWYYPEVRKREETMAAETNVVAFPARPEQTRMWDLPDTSRPPGWLKGKKDIDSPLYDDSGWPQIHIVRNEEQHQKI